MKSQSVTIVGLGYVGLPLAHAFATKGYEVYGYDINAQRIATLKEGHDWTGELTHQQLREVAIHFSDDPEAISKGDVAILAIPTPIDEDNNPDLTPLKKATEAVGKHIRKGQTIVFESTVYPGTTEDICGPILEQASGLKCGEDFYLGYSPERVNPGDKEHTIEKIVKVVSGQNDEVTDMLVELYESVIEAGIHRAPNIQVAEMAKAIENAQRDLNIAFVNEIALLCDKIGITTTDVLAAAGSKWNFLKFTPGLVGGHCIGVDPYYLVEKARQLGMETKVITAGRAINDGMSKTVAEQVLSHIDDPTSAKVLVLGLTFKEDVPDTRNSKSRDTIDAIAASGCTVHIADPQLSESELQSTGYAVGSFEHGPYDAVVLLVAHKEYKNAGSQVYIDATKEDGLVYDLKSLLSKEDIEGAGRSYKAL